MDFSLKLGITFSFNSGFSLWFMCVCRPLVCSIYSVCWPFYNTCNHALGSEKRIAFKSEKLFPKTCGFFHCLVCLHSICCKYFFLFALEYWVKKKNTIQLGQSNDCLYEVKEKESP